MIPCSLVKIIDIRTHTHTHTKKKRKKCTKNDVVNTNNYCNVLAEYIHYIPYERTIRDYNDAYAIYH